MGQEPDRQAVAVADPLDALVDPVGDLGHSVAGEVGQLATLQVRPQELDRVQFGAEAGSRSTVSQSRWVSRWARILWLQCELSPSHNSTTRWPR
jgi:hypothetical protein